MDIEDRRSPRARRRWAWSVFSAVGVVIAVLITGASPVSAHTKFDWSTPADQTTIDTPVEVVTISFTGPATPVGDGFVALDADGVVRTPVSVDSADGRTYEVRFEPALAGGPIGMRWNVQAADAHPIEGAFSFTVTAPAVTTAPTTTSAPSTTSAPTTAPTTVAPTTTAVAPSTEVAAAPPTPASTSTTAPAAADSSGSASGRQSLDEFLAVEESQPGEATALIGRILGFLGVTVALGAIVFGLTTLRGTRSEVRGLLSAAMVLSGVLIVGALVEYIGVATIADDSLGSTWSTSAGFATVLRVVGGLALIAGLLVTTRNDEIGPVARTLSAAVIDDLDRETRNVGRGTVRWLPTMRAWPIALGAAIILASFWFDGHTVNKGFRPLHALVDTVHVAAGSIWVGGVVSLCAIAWWRRRRNEPSGAAELAVRFSPVATSALGVVAVAGAVMAFLVLDSFGDLTGTEWGQTFLVKMGAVAVAVAIGAYNHFRLVPELDAGGGSRQTIQLHNTLTVEAAVLGVVIMASAWLVAAAT